MQKASKAWFLGLLLFSSTSSVPGLLAEDLKPEALYDKSWALIIGIEQYALAPPVPGAVEEAKRVAQAFRQLGFEEITELYNKEATSRRLHQTLSDILTKKAGSMARVVVFFVGHTGMTRDSKGKEVGYLVPGDAQINNVGKTLTVETLKDYTRRSASKHTLMIIDAPIRGWDTTALKPVSPQTDTQARTVQVIAAADKGEKSVKAQGKTVFAQALLTGLSGAADLNDNGWLTASELGTYIKQQVDAVSQGSQHVTSLRVHGDGDTVLVQRYKATPTRETSQQSLQGREAAQAQYEQAVALLQGGKYAEEALVRLNRAIEYDPTFGEAYVLKSYLRLEVLPQLDEALAAGQQAVKHASDNPESFYTLGQVHEKLGHYRQAEEAFVQAAKLNPDDQQVYFSLGTLYADQLEDEGKSVAAFRRYLELGGAHARARAAVSQADEAASPGNTLP
jgi:tetratricopeptide (TPR) repeat protein